MPTLDMRTLISLTTRLVGLLVSVALAACDESAVECEAPPAAETFEVGTGEVCFERVAADGIQPMMEGPQGGYHLWLAFVCSDCGPSVTLEAEAADANGPVGSRIEQVIDLDAGMVAGIQLPMPGDPWDENSIKLEEGTALTINVKLSSSSGAVLHEAAVERTVGPTEVWDYCATHPDDGCCANPCDGL